MPDVTTINPATGDQLETYTHLTKDEAFAKVDACHDAFSEWKLRSLEDRAEVIKGLGEIVGELPELNNGWNCSLSTYDVDAQLRTQILQLFDVSHMPPECVSSNGEYLVPRDHS